MAVIGRGLSGSEMKTYHALSPMHNATLGSTNAVNLGDSRSAVRLIKPF